MSNFYSQFRNNPIAPEKDAKDVNVPPDTALPPKSSNSSFSGFGRPSNPIGAFPSNPVSSFVGNPGFGKKFEEKLQSPSEIFTNTSKFSNHASTPVLQTVPPLSAIGAGELPFVPDSHINTSPVGNRAQQRIDPSQIPRPQLRQNLTLNGSSPPSPTIYYTVGDNLPLPPPSHCYQDYDIRDNGNCAPWFMRSTTYAFPNSNTTAALCGVPLALVVSPMCVPHQSFDVPSVDFGTSGPIRCTRCFGYMNPFVKWIKNGDNWVCNLCNHVNITASWYFATIDGNGNRLDRTSKPELSFGSYDLLVSNEYCVRPLAPVTIVFAIDVSPRSLSTKFTQLAVQSVRNAIACLLQRDQDSGIDVNNSVRVGVFSFSSCINFITIDDKSEFKISTIDIHDPFLPIPPHQWILPVIDGSDKLNRILDQMLDMISPSIDDDSLGSSPVAAVRACLDGIYGHTGHIIVFAPTGPERGYGSIYHRETNANYFMPKNEINMATGVVKLWSTSSSNDEKAVAATYESLAADCAKCCISVYFFIASDSWCDIASLSELAYGTGGAVRLVSGSAESDLVKESVFETIIDWSLTCARETVLKLRCSTGVRVEEYLTDGVCPTTGEVELACFSKDKAISCVLKHDGTIAAGQNVSLQLALLYTSTNGKRHVRVHNLCLPSTSSPQTVYQFCDLDACATHVLHVSSNHLLQFSQLVATREHVLEILVELLFRYRKVVAPSSSTQLIFSDSLRVLPLLVLGMLKHPYLNYRFLPRNSAGVSISSEDILVRGDERSSCIHSCRYMPCHLAVMGHLYPTLLPLHEVINMDVQFPPSLYSTSELLDSDGLFLLDDGLCLILYVGRSFPKAKLFELFGWQFDRHSKPPRTLTGSYNQSGQRVMKIINEVRSRYAIMPDVLVTWPDERTELEKRFAMRLIEDSYPGMPSYMEFLCNIHDRIKKRSAPSL